MISSIQSAWLQERQRYLAHSLGGSQGLSLSLSFSQSGRFISSKGLLLAEELILCDDTVVRMIDKFQFHAVPATGTDQRILAKAFAEEFGERTSGSDAIAFRIRRGVGGEDLGEMLPHLLIADIAVQSVVADALKSLGQNVLNHSSDETEDGKRLVLDGFGLMVPIKTPSIVMFMWIPRLSSRLLSPTNWKLLPLVVSVPIACP